MDVCGARWPRRCRGPLFTVGLAGSARGVYE